MVNGVAALRSGSWTALGATARGASHVRSGIPNQDSHLSASLGDAEGLVLAVADGHGDPRCVRAELGARFAVQSAVRIARGRMQSQPVDSGHDVDPTCDGLAQSIVDDWRAQVLTHQSGHPWTALELAALGRDSVPDAYGSTLLLTIIGQSELIFVQVGDGDILLTSSDGTATRPLPPESNVAGATTSLASAHAELSTNVRRMPLEPSHRMVLLATDGYGNSFDDEQWWSAVCRDYLGLLDRVGPDRIAEQLPGWTADSAQAAGDDVTVLIAVRS